MLILLGWCGNAQAAGETYTFSAPADDARVFSVTSRVTVDGQLQTALGGGKAQALKLHVDASFQHRERRLPGTGRDAAALRALRMYSRADAVITVSQQRLSERLRPARRLIIAQGQRSGVVFYSPRGPLTGNEVELLDGPGDSLAMPALLPLRAVAVGDVWSPASWVIQMLTGTDAVLKSRLQCKFESLTNHVARITCQGSLDGAVDGAATNIKLSGHLTYNLDQRYITGWELVQTEKTSIGPVSPGREVTARIVVNRARAKKTDPLTDAIVGTIPLEPKPSQMLLVFRSPMNIRFPYDRHWHIFHQTGKLAVLRLLEKGSLIAQCNIRSVTAAAPGQHTPEQQFQADIREALGANLKSITKAEQLKVTDGRFLYRVTAKGTSHGIEMDWIYYLCADPSGRQIAMVFSVESKLREKLTNRDLEIVNRLRFVDPKRSPTPAASE